MPFNRQLLALIGKRFPAVYDGPIGPQVFLQGRTGAAIALNPQPLPPYELGTAVAAEFIHTAWISERFGLDQGKLFSDIDDLCPPLPKLPKPPRGWPWPWPKLDPHPDWLAAYHLGFAVRLAVTSVNAEETKLGELLDAAIGRSVEIISAFKS